MSAALLTKLIEAGTPAELVGEVAMELARAEAAAKAIETKRAYDREYQRERRRTTSYDSNDVADKGSLEVSPPAPPLPNPSKSSPLNPPKLLEEKREAVASILRRAFPVDRYRVEWNEMAAKHGLPQIECIRGKRLRALNARYAEHGEEAISRAISAVPNSPHWLGENGWLGNFDSLMRPDNFQRMIEGAYAPKQDPPAKPLTDEQIRAIERRYTEGGMESYAAEMRKKYPQSFTEVASNIVKRAAA